MADGGSVEGRSPRRVVHFQKFIKERRRCWGLGGGVDNGKNPKKIPGNPTLTGVGRKRSVGAQRGGKEACGYTPKGPRAGLMELESGGRLNVKMGKGRGCLGHKV